MAGEFVPDLVASATAILAQSERRVEIVGQNIANATTPGYKRRIPFVQMLTQTDGSVASQVSAVIDNRPGKLVVTNNPFDLALTGPGLFALRDPDGMRFSRQGRFSRNAEGQLIDALGGVLQLANGGDVVASSADFEVRMDGTIVQRGEARGRIAVYREAAGQAAGPAEPADAPGVRQGAFEASNVTTGDEMVTMMEAMRRAESAQRVMITYDELMARAITTFGGGG